MATRVHNPMDFIIHEMKGYEITFFGIKYVPMYMAIHLTRSDEPDVLHFTGIIMSNRIDREAIKCYLL